MELAGWVRCIKLSGVRPAPSSSQTSVLFASSLGGTYNSVAWGSVGSSSLASGLPVSSAAPTFSSPVSMVEADPHPVTAVSSTSS